MTSKVYVALRVKAPPERAFAAFVGEIGAWWRPNGLFQTTPRAPGVLAFEPGEGGRLTETLANGKVFEIGRITAWEPPTRLVFSWRQANFPPDSRLVVGCKVGGRSARACQILEDAGYSNLVNMDGGFHGRFDPMGRLVQPGWSHHELPTSTDNGDGVSHASLAAKAEGQ